MVNVMVYTYHFYFMLRLEYREGMAQSITLDANIAKAT